MLLVKPIIEPRRLRDLLASHFGHRVDAIAPIDQGHIARTFSFAAGDADYVVRFSYANLDAGYEKEEFVTRTFSSEAIPIPRVVAVGRLEGKPCNDESSRVIDVCYCITEKASGRTVSQLSPGEIDEALPSILETLDSIHDCDVATFAGWGLFGGDGRGSSATWTEYLCGVRNEEREDGFFGRWHHVFESTFIERHGREWTPDPKQT